MAKHDNRMPIQTALGYVEEARAASRDWRAKSWRDHEMYDGDQWTPEDRQRAVDAGIDPLTINRIFPAINLILGSQELNRANIIAKARTAKDGQIAEIMHGTTPARRPKAVRWVQKVGFVSVGELPYAVFMADTGRNEPGLISYADRTTAPGAWCGEKE